MKPEEFWQDFESEIVRSEAQEKLPEMLEVLEAEKAAYKAINEAAQAFLTREAFTGGQPPDPETLTPEERERVAMRFTNYSAAMVRALMRSAARLMAEIKTHGIHGDEGDAKCDDLTNTLMHAMQDAIMRHVTSDLPKTPEQIRQLMKEITKELEKREAEGEL
jgi:hypothetical protein